MSVTDVVKQSWLGWLGHVLKKDDSDWVKRSMTVEVDETAVGRHWPTSSCGCFVFV